MADEPILCFDGDAAGIRAAHRAAELALPLLLPGKSLRFALLPEGKDPDDLIRAEGRDGMAAVLAAAAPLVDLLWSHATAAGSFETPERRAALEARLSDLARTIADDSVRRHYAQAFAERVQSFFPGPERGAGGEWRRANRRRGAFDPRSDRSTRPSLLASRSAIPVSDRLKGTALLRPRGGHPLRETVLVMTLLHHPGLLQAHLDEFAHLDLADRDLAALRAAILDLVAAADDGEAGDARSVLAAGRFGPLIERLDAQIRACSLGPYMASEAVRDAEQGWRQALTLHRRQRTLHKDLRDAEAALALDPNEAHFARLQDIHGQMAAAEGTEALIEGFGASGAKRML
jgi:DNA primase